MRSTSEMFVTEEYSEGIKKTTVVTLEKSEARSLSAATNLEARVGFETERWVENT
jgi:hypothetical protein